ncbi:MAG: hypothetical protein ABI462_03810 [Ignavibacteria bacterium]
MKRVLNISIIPVIVILFLSCSKPAIQRTDNEIKVTIGGKDTCEGPDADINCYFAGMPADLTNIMKIADDGEPGERMIITGQVLRSDRVTPYPGVIMYAYHTDNKGYYSKKGTETGIRKWHGHLYGWCVTDENGRYEIHSIRPSRYPGNIAPAHIHSALKFTNDSQPVHINDFVFKDDSLVDENYISSQRYEGGSGVVELIKSSDGILRGERKIVLEK